MEIEATEIVKVNVETLKIHIKVTDRFTASIVSSSGRDVYNQDGGYVPGFMPGDHYGDYLILDINIDTGQITNWEKPSAKQIQEWIRDDVDY